ncbi:O-antigen ligase family protein [Teichococcus oryzae]|uniref:O-antigen ligase domain-containing protein n=1 Tax=Teichococcus oryzae TaxID=1608942 RepID=A0A5B2TH45_9PROT|nr:O-antigen ligase family protein [Pseudoroseomonas oryzae]KAA2213797.1 O-antigen ligase domain-containing protein [Pseudoroseomonas oryzae]
MKNGQPLGAIRVDAAGIGSLAGLAGAALHFAGALKSTPPGAALPVDLTLLAAALLPPLLAVLLLTRRWWLHGALALPLAGAALLWLWLVLAGVWSRSAVILPQKLPEIVLVAPPMLVAGMLLGADASARRWLVRATLGAGPLVAASVAWGLATGNIVLGGMVGAQPDLLRVQYQLAGLAIACAAGLGAVRIVEAPAWPSRLFWSAYTLGLAAAALLPGGRMGLISLGLSVLLTPALRCWSAGRTGLALRWSLAAALAAMLGAGLLLLQFQAMEGLRTLERFTEGGMEASARPALWRAALDWAGAALPLGLGTGGFTIAAGHGERRGLYPHNHALEAFAEGGPLGLVLWLCCFGGGAVLLLLRARHAAPARVAQIAALVLPVGLAAMVSTDLGNRMVWFALGLALSTGMVAKRVA